MTDADRVRAELDILGLDASRHVVDFHAPFLDRLGITRSVDLLSARSRSELLVAGVKVATQTPPIRSGRRVIFLTLDDATGPVDATFFEDVQGPYAATVFGSWLLVVRGELRRTGRRGVSLRATGAWDLGALHDLWQAEGMDAVHAALSDRIGARLRASASVPRRAPSRVMVHTSGFRMSPYADIKPAGRLHREPSPARWPASCGTAAPGARDDSPRVGPMDRPIERRTAARTAVVWDAVRALLDDGSGEQRVLDIGGGTGGFAVRLAGLGHRVTVVDPSPDALAALARRADEDDVADRVTGLQGDLGNLRELAPERGRPRAVPRRARPRRRPGRCPGDDHLGPAPRWRPLPAGQPAARRRARPGDGRPLRPGPGDPRGRPVRPQDRGERRFTAEEVAQLLGAAGFTTTSTHGIRVFADLVPSSLLDLEPGASAALLDLERAVAERPEYLTLASQLHVVATR